MGGDVVFHPLAADDLDALDDFMARDVVKRIEARCESLARLPERGVAHHDFGDGIRLLLSERRIVIAYRIDTTSTPRTGPA